MDGSDDNKKKTNNKAKEKLYSTNRVKENTKAKDKEQRTNMKLRSENRLGKKLNLDASSLSRYILEDEPIAYNPTNGVIFKNLFGFNMALVKSLVNEVLEYRGKEEVSDLTNLSVSKNAMRVKQSFLDVTGVRRDKRTTNVHFLISPAPGFEDRLPVFLNRAYPNLTKKEQTDRNLDVQIIAIVERPFDESGRCLLRKKLLDNVHMTVLQLRNFDMLNKQSLKRSISRWFMFFKYGAYIQKQDIKHYAPKGTSVELAFNLLHSLRIKFCDLKDYEDVELYQQEWAAIEAACKREGIARSNLQLAEAMIKIGETSQKIAKYTDFTETEVDLLRTKICSKNLN